MTPPTPVERPKAQKPISWWMVMLVVVAIIAVSALAYVWFVDPIPSTSIDLTDADLDLAGMRSEARRNALTVAAGLGGLAALLLAFRRQRHAERQQQYHEYETQRAHEQQEKEHAHQLDEAKRQFEQREKATTATEADALQRRITELRIRAVEQLGSANPTVRIGGLHNLERLGQLHPELRQTVLDEICAYLRMPYTPPEPVRSDDSAQRFEPVGPPPLTRDDSAAQERQVRLTAQSILTRHLRFEGGEDEDPPESYWNHERLDLGGAHLETIDFSRCRIRGGRFGTTRFSDFADFHGARFDDTPDFSGADFYDHARFNAAHFSDNAEFSTAHFHKLISFQDVQFSGFASFDLAVFKGGTIFIGARFNGGCGFERAAFLDAWFSRAHFNGSTTFADAGFMSMASFRGSIFHGTVVFDGARLNRKASLDGARFAGPEQLPAGWKTVEVDDDLGGHIAVRIDARADEERAR